MNFLSYILEGKLDDARTEIFRRIDELVLEKVDERKKSLANERIEEAVRKNPNIIRMGRVQKIRRRIRRNAKGRIIVQKDRKRSALAGYRVSGATVKRISASERLRKTRKLKLSWKTSRRAKLRRTLLKRKMSMQRRKGLGLR